MFGSSRLKMLSVSRAIVGRRRVRPDHRHRESGDPVPASPWLAAPEAGAYIKRGRRFVLREVAAGRLRAARVGGRGEILTKTTWLDEWAEAQSAPVLIPFRKRA